MDPLQEEAAELAGALKEAPLDAPRKHHQQIFSSARPNVVELVVVVKSPNALGLRGSAIQPAASPIASPAAFCNCLEPPPNATCYDPSAEQYVYAPQLKPRWMTAKLRLTKIDAFFFLPNYILEDRRRPRSSSVAGHKSRTKKRDGSVSRPPTELESPDKPRKTPFANTQQGDDPFLNPLPHLDPSTVTRPSSRSSLNSLRAPSTTTVAPFSLDDDDEELEEGEVRQRLITQPTSKLPPAHHASALPPAPNTHTAHTVP
ncbi:hypothetical protein R3P38DRAFT_3239461 [Favolaschia claudopus]|uniref:Uncharacterized protein n=1 Tax=Favolaschia claudopus TaxID=2862362 RepID=A0AAV9Z7S1_9AGAR